MGNKSDSELIFISQDIAEGNARGFDLHREGEDSVFVVRFNGVLYGWRNDCPHIKGAAMAWRKDAYLNASKTHICCHAHGALFEMDSGLCIRGPCKGKKLQPIEVIEIGDGNVMISDLSQ